MTGSCDHNLSGGNPKGGKRRSLRFVILLVPLLLLFTAAVVILGVPRRWQVDPVVSPAEAVRLQEIIRKMTSSMVTEDGKMAETAVIEFTPAEINTMLTTGLRAAQRNQSEDFYYDAEWLQGTLLVRACRILPVFAVNLEAVVVPAIQRGKVTFSVRSCRIGWLPLKPKTVENLLRETLKKYEDRPEFQALTSIVESLTVKNDRIVLQIRPDNINQIIPLLLKAVMGKR